MDFLNIGAIGFAQVGSNDFYDKEKIEKEVLREYMKTDIFKVPDEFQGMAFFGIKRFTHDMGSYSEIVLYYEDGILMDWEEEHNGYNETYDPNQIYDDEEVIDTKYTRFWDFANEAERIDLETEELMQQCQKAYGMKVVHIKPPEENDDEQQLKKA